LGKNTVATTPKFPLGDADQIFGNEAAEDETDSIFSSYVLYRQEVQRFTDAARPLQVVRAYKGEGKSALLRLVEKQLKSTTNDTLIIRTTGQSLSPSLESQDSDQWVREWKKRILERIANEIGATLSMAFTDDAISLVESAEQNTYKSRSFVSSITDRLKSKSVPIERTRTEIVNHEPLLKRWLNEGSPVWLFIDDLDQNFKNEPLHKLKVATCFIAVRQIFSQIPEIRFRLAVRPNVWSIIKMEFEALSHVEQYMVELPWSDEMFLDLVARRIEAYLQRSDQWVAVERDLPGAPYDRYIHLLASLFQNPILWGGKKRHVYVALHTLSCHRPRWLIELCKVASTEAARKGHTAISLEDVTSQLDAFGQKRIEDMVAEFTSLCAQIKELIFAFSGQNERYATDALLTTIERRILQGVQVRIVGLSAKPSSRDVAHFLFQIGFLSARLDYKDGTYEHLAFADRPNLLAVNTNVDEGVSWEIHPVFRDTLRLKDVQSKSERSWTDRRPPRGGR
jgi:hypothetical protein